MNTILVPTDFSNNARNAAKFAMKLAADLGAKKIVFYNAYQAPPVLTEAAVPAMPIMDIETMKSISSDGLALFQKTMAADCPEGIQLEHQSEYSVLSNDINDICEKAGAELIVMGITGTSKIEETLIGSTAVSVMKHTKIPVIVVPEDATYHSIKKVMLACDYKKVAETTPLSPIKSILDATGASLDVVNVYENDKKIDGDKTYQQELLQSLFRDYNVTFHFVNSEDVITGINEYAEANNTDMIIAIPRKHRFFDGLFKERNSKKLAFHTHVPLMYIHQQDL
jgi:nucleotide-binding universal stress UspA family protein